MMYIEPIRLHAIALGTREVKYSDVQRADGIMCGNTDD